MKNKLIVLSGIFILGILMRTINLESNPANLNSAELRFGMNFRNCQIQCRIVEAAFCDCLFAYYSGYGFSGLEIHRKIQPFIK